MTETTSSPPEPAEVWITGIGLATSLGEGLDANWDALMEDLGYRPLKEFFLNHRAGDGDKMPAQ